MSRGKLAGILAAVIILVGSIAGLALAQTNPNFKESLYQDFVAKLAANLGLDQSKVTAALKDTKKQMLDEAVQKGTITQEQADRIAANDNICWFGNCGRECRFGKFPADKSVYSANVLGMTPEQLKAELQSGKSIEQIVTEHGMTMEQFKQKVSELCKQNEPMRNQLHNRIAGKNMEDTASVLGMTPEQLKAELQSGKKIEQIVTEHGMTIEQFHQKILEIRKK